MLKRILIASTICLFLAVGLAPAADETPSITFGWTQDDETYAVLTRWQLGVGTGPGTGYTQFIDIPKSNPQPDGSYQGTADVIYSGAPGEVVTKYFKLRACISASDTECSAWSGEVSHAVTIPIGPPTDFTKVSATISIKIVPTIKTSGIEDDSRIAKR